MAATSNWNTTGTIYVGFSGSTSSGDVFYDNPSKKPVKKPERWTPKHLDWLDAELERVRVDVCQP